MSASTFFDRHADKAYAVFRLVVGLLFAFHGQQKIFGWMAEVPQPATGSQYWWGGMIELVCGLLVALGLFTRPAAFLACGEMAVAYLQFHWKVFTPPFTWDFAGAFGERALPSVNHGELALLYCFAFLTIWFSGGRRCSVDRLFARAREERRFQSSFAREVVPEADADAFLARQIEFDSDIWIVAVDDRQGRHFLDEWLARP